MTLYRDTCIVPSGSDFVKFSFKTLRAVKMVSLDIKANNLWDPSMVPVAGHSVLVVSHLLTLVMVLDIPGQAS